MKNGSPDGSLVGVDVGSAVGCFEGLLVDSLVGLSVGRTDGVLDGHRDGEFVGLMVFEGAVEGFEDGKYGAGVGFFEHRLHIEVSGHIWHPEHPTCLPLKVGHFPGLTGDGAGVDTNAGEYVPDGAVVAYFALHDARNKMALILTLPAFAVIEKYLN